jgi:high-affinity K+ transport system ATPase subunit B
VQPGTTSCPNCGEALPILRGPVPDAAAIQGPPAAVRNAIKLLWVAVGIGLLTLAFSLISIADRLPSTPRFLAPIALRMLLWVLAIIFAGQRSNPARIVIFLLVAYSAFTLLIRLRLSIPHANPGALIAILELALRLYAVYLLLRPESNDWFARKAI